MMLSMLSATAIKDSHNVPSVVPSTDGNVLTSNGTDWVSEAPTGGASQLSDLSDVVSATNTDKFALMANGTTGYVGRALVEADISDLGTYAATDQTFYIGTTQVAINRASAALTIAGLTLTTPNIGTPSAGTLTNCTFPTLNQNTTGSAATLTTTRAIYGNNFDGSAALTQVIASTYGGTGNGFTKFTGPATAERTFTLPNANATLLYSGGALGTPSAGTLTSCTGLPAAAVVAGSLVAGMIAADHGTAATDQLVNVCYGTSATPPTASDTTEGTLYIQYTN